MLIYDSDEHLDERNARETSEDEWRRGDLPHLDPRRQPVRNPTLAESPARIGYRRASGRIDLESHDNALISQGLSLG